MSETAAKPRTLASKIMRTLRLPEEITPFEHEYLARMNRITFGFFLTNIPVFMLVGWWHETGVAMALGLSVLTLLGPAIALFTLSNPRHISLVHGVASMCMGGVLVHLGQGPMQIEMHFYFFILLAMLAMFGNPLVILIAAATVSLHHLVVYFLLPASVFNYDASIWVVLVHALFVVIESVASVFLARSFFDNVIGLEKIVQKRTDQLVARNRDLRLVLDNVAQALMTVNLDGELSNERSAVVEQWFGDVEGNRLADLFASADEATAEWFELGLESLRDGFLPFELCIEQLPSSLELDGKNIRVDYTPLFSPGGELEGMLVMMSDITARLKHERLEREQREFVTLFSRLQEDRVGFLEFFSEVNLIMERLEHDFVPERLTEILREVHTAKGNCALFGLASISEGCHELENHLTRDFDEVAHEQAKALVESWKGLRVRFQKLVDTSSSKIEIDDHEYHELLRDTLAGCPHEVIAERIRSWRFEPVQRRLERLAEQAQGLARRLGKGEVEVDITSDNVRLEPERWRSFWTALVHVLRNAIDHGIEPTDVRLDRGKSPVGRISLSARVEHDALSVSVADDGNGINWSQIKRRAKARGIADPSNETELYALLFVDGLSSREEVTETSGRGVGMAAVLEQCNALGGQISVETTLGKGTAVVFEFPSIASGEGSFFPETCAAE